ncbi:ABC transporter ATP-binding protein [Pseudorhizobium flavum]|uniref:Lipopolysaccharide transport system ATP-binding protein n=1 Tax=Pseudorhizobium flavum TaxID=1335061 RepID=A0A7W9Z111_9HYPH|nr:ABC transporter ATP-binding protein [Pseudorhizobium flavum]MBB6182068.1 lipopolysaccharide transport system ATP-binding protein [Pseudorhizobium flavum]CAD6632172.1 ABC transporter ATP-binding protein [Pseudorhizobium flavum]
MTQDPVLTVNGLGKVFRRYKRELHRVLNWFSFQFPPAEEHWVLRDISFEVRAGEALGIVGRNGAGKSTLLKMITGTTRPSEGGVHFKGRIAAILELGMGFNYDYTGRQNVYHASGLMGLQRSDMDAIMPELEAFAELGAYFDQPIRVYSSGMQVRLAFAVATAFRPDILIIDEALSVGDAYFQHKSFDKIKQFREQGTTLILVSHDRLALLSLCDRALLLDQGRLALDGDPESVLDYYNALLGRKEGDVIETSLQDDGRIQTISGSREATIETATLVNTQGEPIDTIEVGSEVEIRVVAKAHKAIPRLVLGYAIKDRLGQTMYGTNTHYSQQALDTLQAGETVEYSIRFPVALGPGTYSVALALSGAENHLGQNYEWRDLAIMFSVVNLREQAFDGKIFMPSSIEVRRSARPDHEDG